MSTMNDYQQQAARTLRRAHPSHPEFDQRREHNIAVMGLGIAGEAGEVADYLKKVLGHGHELDLTKLAKELGDVLWYVAALATMHGLRLDDIATTNISKLRERFPNGFTEADSIARKDVREEEHMHMLINGVSFPAMVGTKVLYEQVVQLAKLSGSPSMTVKSPDGSGRIVHPGDEVLIINGMSFSVVHTGNA